jgi:hypothetical protein
MNKNNTTKQEEKKCKCSTKYCKHYESDFDRFLKENPTDTKQEGWEERFDKKFVLEYSNPNFSSKLYGSVEDIKDFISQTIQTAKQEAREEVLRKVYEIIGDTTIEAQLKFWQKASDFQKGFLVNFEEYSSSLGIDISSKEKDL